MQVYFELKNYQWTEPVELENTRVWHTNVFVGRYFNEFIRNEMKKGYLEKSYLNVLINYRLMLLIIGSK